MAVEKNIDAEHQDHRNEKLAHGGHDGVRGIVHHVGLEKPAPFAGAVEQDGHGAHGGEQHKGFAQGIEGTVVQDHARHGVHRAGLLRALLHIAPGHLVDGGGGVGAVGGQVRRRQQHQDRQHPAQKSRQNVIQPQGAVDAQVEQAHIPPGGGAAVVVLRRALGGFLLKLLGQVQPAVEPELHQGGLRGCRHGGPPLCGPHAPRPCQ